MSKKLTQLKQEVLISKLTKNRVQFQEELDSRIEMGQKIFNKSITTIEALKEHESEFYVWSDYNLELLKRSFNIPNNEYHRDYQNAGSMIGAFGAKNEQEHLDNLKDKIKRKINELEKLNNKLSLIPCEDEDKTSAKLDNDTELSNDIFIVHGQDNRVKEEVARTISKLGLNPIILHEQSNLGKTIIEKFEKYSNVRFAIILMTGDDEGKSIKDPNLKLRARQNVILELGYFMGKLGRDKICPLYSEGVDLPSDLYGIVYVPIDASGKWRFSLVKEMQSSGINVDANKLL